MVFVMLGTQDKQFNRLLKLVEKNIKGDVIAQIGNTIYNGNKIKTYEWLEQEEITKYIKECDYMIIHGGVGSIIEGLKYNKRIIVVPRLSKYKEHVNDHQLDITRFCEANNYVIACYKDKDFKKCLKKLNNFKPSKYKSNTINFTNSLKSIIDKY